MQVWGMGPHPVYLWTLPMFHCNGWCFPWTVTALAGTHVCLRQVRARAIYDAIAEHGVTHLCGAPIVMQLRSEEHTSAIQSLMRTSYAVFCLKKKKEIKTYT